MKNGYERPMVTVEEYELNTAIATGCDNKVSLGPYDYEYNGTFYTTCSEYDQGTFDSESPTVANFFPDGCSCYLSAGGEIVFTS